MHYSEAISSDQRFQSRTLKLFHNPSETDYEIARNHNASCQRISCLTLADINAR